MSMSRIRVAAGYLVMLAVAAVLIGYAKTTGYAMFADQPQLLLALPAWAVGYALATAPLSH